MYVCVLTGHKKGKERMEGVGETEEGGVSRPQKSIGWEERAKIICTGRGQRSRANRGWGSASETQREAGSTKTVRDRTDNRLTLEKVSKTNREPHKKKKRERDRQKGENTGGRGPKTMGYLNHSVPSTNP